MNNGIKINYPFQETLCMACMHEPYGICSYHDAQQEDLVGVETIEVKIKFTYPNEK